MLELGSSGFVRGVSSNGHPYRDPPPVADLDSAFGADAHDFHAYATPSSAALHEGLRQVITRVFQNYAQFPAE